MTLPAMVRRLRRADFGEQGLDRFGMHRPVDHGGGSAVAGELVEEEARDGGAVGGIGEALLLDEGVGVQPVEQLRAIGGDHLGLGQMDVGVDQARQDQAVGVVLDRRGRRQGREKLVSRADRFDAAVRDHQDAVLEVPVARGCRMRVVAEGQELPAQRLAGGGHATRPGRRRRARRRASGAPRA